MTSKRIDLFNILSSYMETSVHSRKACFGICTDGDPSMDGSMKDFASLVKQEKPDLNTLLSSQRDVEIKITWG